MGDELFSDFVSKEVDKVELIYTKFVSLISSQPTVQTLLPLTPQVGQFLSLACSCGCRTRLGASARRGMAQRAQLPHCVQTCSVHLCPALCAGVLCRMLTEVLVCSCLGSAAVSTAACFEPPTQSPGALQGEICDIDGKCVDAAEDELFKLTTKEGKITVEREVSWALSLC